MIVEEAMIGLKGHIGSFCAEHRIPIIEKVYRRPEPEQLDGLLQALQSVGIQTTADHLTDPVDVTRILASLQLGSSEERAIYKQMLALFPFGARYSSELSGHDLLGLAHYAPIKGREGAGVWNQALLADWYAGRESPPSGELRKGANAFNRLLHLFEPRLTRLVYLQTIEYVLQQYSGKPLHANVTGLSEYGITLSIPAIAKPFRSVIEEHPAIQRLLRFWLPRDTELKRSRNLTVQLRGFHPAGMGFEMSDHS